MKNVDLIRKRVVAGQQQELRRIRVFVSSTDGNIEVLQRMEGDQGAQLLAEVSEFIMAKLGNQARASKASRVAAKATSPQGQSIDLDQETVDSLTLLQKRTNVQRSELLKRAVIDLAAKHGPAATKAGG